MQNTKLLLKNLILPNLDFQISEEFKFNVISDGDKELNSFFKNWIPSKLDLLSVNYPNISTTGIKMGFYIDSISKAIMSVSKEIYLTCFKIKESELEQIIKSASNWERLILFNSNIHCSKKLDFSVSAKYKIKFLSFAGCGSAYLGYRKTDWKSIPSCFKNIVEAISKSGLKDSLKQVDIFWNSTLDKDEVQAMFNELEMPNISVVQNCPPPME